MSSRTLFPSFGRFSVITDALCRAVAASLGRGLMDAAMILLVWQRVRRIEVLLLALVERFRSGRMRLGKSQRAIPAAANEADAQNVPGTGGALRAGGYASHRLPRQFGWLLVMMPYVAAGYGSQLRALLEEPDMAALLAESPQARRILGPLCRMVGVEAVLLTPERVSSQEAISCVAVPETVDQPWAGDGLRSEAGFPYREAERRSMAR